MTAKRTLQYRLFETAFGASGVAWSAAGLVRVQLPERDVAATKQRLEELGGVEADSELPRGVIEAIAELRDYFDGQRVDFAGVALDHSALGEFNGRVYAALRTVGYGETTTYGGLATLAGSPGAAQAVGTAMGRNPWPVIVPCHRVLAATQSIGGFSAYGGATTKAKLLRMEGVVLDRGQLLLPGL
jgi:methylated-DNA-[protein]-cysteine S-methyltransferase